MDMHRKRKKSETRYLSSNSYLYAEFFIFISLNSLLATILIITKEKRLFGFMAFLALRAYLVSWHHGVSYNDNTLTIRRLHQRWDFSLDQVVGLKHWKFMRLACLEIAESGQVRKFYFGPNYSRILPYFITNYSWKYAAFDDFKTMMEQRIPVNRIVLGIR